MAKSLKYSFLFGLGLILLLIPETGFSQTAADTAVALREAYNRELIGAIGQQFLSTPILIWETGILKWMFAYCFIIAFFQSILISDPKAQMSEWTRIAFAAVFALLLVGKIPPSSVGLRLVGSAPPNYQYTRGGSPESLDREIFNFLAWKFDSLGDALFGTDPNTGRQVSPAEFYQEKASSLLSSSMNLLKAREVCGKGQKTCVSYVLKYGQAPNQADQASETNEEGSTWWAYVPGATAASAIGTALGQIISAFTDPYFWLYLLLSVLNFIRAALTSVVLIAFGIITAMSLFFIKLFASFLLLKSHWRKVLTAAKYAMSAAMYGFLMKLVLFLSGIIAEAMSVATTSTITSQISSGATADAILAALGQLTISNTISVVVISLFQIVALAKIPNLARNLVDLSFTEIINLGEVLFSAGLGMAKMVGAMAITGGAAAAGGAAGAMAGSGSKLGAAASAGVNKLKGKSSLGGVKDKAMRRGLAGDSLATGSSGGAKKKPSGGGSGGSSKVKLDGGSGSLSDAKSILKDKVAKKKNERADKNAEKVIVDDTGSDARITKIDKDISKGSDYKVSDSASPGGENTRMYQYQKDQAEVLKKQRNKKIKDQLSKAGKMASGAGKMAGGLAWAALETGAGRDAISGEFSNVLQKSSKITQDGAKKSFGAGRAAVDQTAAGVGKAVDFVNKKRGKESTKDIMNQAVDTSYLIEQDNNYIGNRLDEEGEARVRALMESAESDTASEDEMLELYKLNNQYSFGKELQSDYDSLEQNELISFGTSDKLAMENDINNKLIGKIQKQAETGNFNQKDLGLAAQRVDSGMMSARFLSDARGSQPSVGEKLIEHRGQKISTAFQGIQSKVNKNPNYKFTEQDRDVAAMTAQFMPQAFVGNAAAVSMGSKVLGERSQLGKKLQNYKPAYKAPIPQEGNYSEQEVQTINSTLMGQATEDTDITENGYQNFLGMMAVDVDANGTTDQVFFYDQYGKKQSLTDYDEINSTMKAEDRERARRSFHVAETIVEMANAGTLGEFSVKMASGQIVRPELSNEDIDLARKLVELKSRTKDDNSE